MSKKKQGAQPGNVNAVKHGFYSPRFTPEEIGDLSAILRGGLLDEEYLARVFIDRAIAWFNDHPAQTLDDIKSQTETVLRGATTLAHILRVKSAYLGTGDDPSDDLVVSTIRKVMDDKKEEFTKDRANRQRD